VVDAAPHHQKSGRTSWKPVIQWNVAGHIWTLLMAQMHLLLDISVQKQTAFKLYISWASKLSNGKYFVQHHTLTWSVQQIYTTLGSCPFWKKSLEIFRPSRQKLYAILLIAPHMATLI
jgi:hypothetical protein